MKVSRHFNSNIKLFLTMLFIAGVTLFSLIRSDLLGAVAASPHVTNGNTSSTCSSWSIVPNPIPSHSLRSKFNGVAAISSKDVWAVGSYFVKQFQTNTLTEHWNGTKWQIVTSPNPEQGDLLDSVAALSTNDIWATGEGFSSGPPSQAFIEHSDGTSWQAVSSPQTTPPSSLKNVTVVPGNW